MMMSRKLWIAAAAVTLASGLAARNGMAQGTMKHDMGPGAMKHDMSAVPSLASMIQRADSLVVRTEQMAHATTDTTAHAMMMDHGAGNVPEAMADNLRAMAIGLRGVLLHMEAMHLEGMKMEGDAGTAMMDVHRRMNTILGELEKTLPATGRMHAAHEKGSR